MATRAACMQHLFPSIKLFKRILFTKMTIKYVLSVYCMKFKKLNILIYTEDNRKLSTQDDIIR